ncbi:MAG: sulfatase-like hydrolase/transferase [Alphaproteobacteria bacterium]|nr:sulfatase-like hydrolase/transferase [Alphaproteobacteria bacterium]
MLMATCSRLVLRPLVGMGAVVSMLAAPAGVSAQEMLPQLPPQPQKFDGITPAESQPPSWPAEPQAPKGAPNVLLIMTDDIGFGTSSTFGGPVPTPTLDMLAKDGLRYNQFNTTALCSPTRAALLTGRNPHNVGMGNVENLSAGYDGYNSVIPKSAGMVSEVLREDGYSTAAFGKWHLTPQWEQSQAGPFDRWPTGEGFEYFYGFLASDTSQWNPVLTEGTKPIDPAAGHPGYNLDEDLATRSIKWIQQHHALAPDKPFFVYYATGTAHTPHHAPKAWLEKFRGKFDQGWDKVREETFARQKAMGIIPANAKLTPRPDVLPAWSSLSPKQKKLYARLMEAYAAAVAHMDSEVGRLIQYLKDSGQYDNTLIIFIEGDNGSSAEGGPNGLLFQQSMINGYKEDLDYMVSRIPDIGGPMLYNHYPAAWGWAMDTPFQYYKQIASYFGGTRNGLVISWPNEIKDKGGLRSQFHYVTDIAPTIYQAVGVQAPAMLDGVPQKPLDGVSMEYSFTAPDAPSHRHMQYFEMVGNRGIYKDGWVAAMRPFRQPWGINEPGAKAETQPWELYHVADDYSEAVDLSKANPQKLRDMQNLFWAEAGRNQVLPIRTELTAEGRPSLAKDRTVFTYPAGMVRISQDTAPHIVNRSFSVEADVVVPQGGAKGVLVTQGGRFGGWGMYVKDDKVVFHYNALDPRRYTIRAQEPLTPGPHKVVADFKSDGGKFGPGGVVTISVDGHQVGQGRVEHTLGNWISHTEGMDIGLDTGTPIDEEYDVADSKFTGDLKGVTIRLK